MAPALRARSSANKAVGDDMLPKSRSTSRDSARSSFAEPEHLLRSVEDLGPARMQQEARELAEAHAARIEKALHRAGQVIADEAGEIGAQHHAEAVLLDVPAHDALGIGQK